MRAASLGLTVALLMAVSAVAQTRLGRLDPATARNLRVACAADTTGLCARVQPGGGRIMQCLRANLRELQPECRRALMALRTQPAPASGDPAPSTAPYPRL